MTYDRRGNPGKPRTEETKRKISKAFKGKKISEEHKRKISKARKGTTHTKKTKQKISKALQGKPCTKKAKRKISATLRGISYDEWESFAKKQKYCPKFNESCRESNREKYGRRCFICNKTEKANGQRLSVHHVDMDRAQGCESNWKLVPLCKSCHVKAHNNELIARLGYIISG